ncbi:MAG: hypothetical protein K2P53_03070 [Rickettsiales bacterium]|jgi:hypothetical protein|nr:hypothetical protein [Rickettsiales bacterium]
MKALPITSLFSFVSESNKYVCLMCPEKGKLVCGPAPNLRKHIFHVHKKPEYLYDSQKKMFAQDQLVETQNKDEIDEAVINCIVQDGRPFNDFHKPGMQLLLNVLAPLYKPPHRKTIANRLRKKYYQYKNDLKDELKSVTHIALATDLWKNRVGSYWLCITAHYLTKKFKYRSKVVCFRRFYGRQLSNRLTTFVQKEINKLEIDNKVISITTDNAEDIKKAMGSIALRLSCICHNLNLVLNHGMKLWIKPSRNILENTEDIDEDLIYYNNYNESDIESNGNISSDDNEDISCTSDKEAVSSSDEESSDEEAALTETVDHLFNFSSSILFRLRKTVALVKRSSILQSFVFSEIKKQGLKIKNLSSDFHVRWNSTFLMISKIIKAKYVYNKITIDPGTIDGLTEKQITKLKKLTLLSEDWKFLDILHHNLAPFFEATKLLSTRNFPSLSSAKFVQNTLMNFLENESSAKCFLSQLSPLVERENMIRGSLLKFMKVYFVEKISPKQKLQSLLACFFDPRTIECLTEKEHQEAESTLLKKFSNSILRQYPRRSSTCLQKEQNQPRSG